MDEIFPGLFPLIFVGMWVAIGLFVASIGGWRSLARQYSWRASEFEGQRWHMRSGAMRWSTQYNNVLTIGANTRGLYLAVMFLFRVGHPPLYITWDKIAIVERKGWVFRYVIFSFQDVPGVQLTVSRRLGAQIAETAGRRIAEEQTSSIA